MATHDDVGLSQPVASTITKRLDAITLNINSTDVIREVMVIGDPESSVAIARASSVAPKSTDVGLNVRIISGPSTATDFAVRAILPSTATDNLVRAVQGFGISSAADRWIFAPSDTNFASSAGFHFTSSGEMLASLPNLSKVGPGDTNFASSAGFHFDSSGSLQITGAAASTGPLALSSNSGAFNSSNSSLYLAVRLTNGTAFTDAAPFYTHNSTGDFTGSTIASQPNLIRSGAAASGSTDHFYAQWGTSNGAGYMTPADAAGNAMWSSIIVPSTGSAMAVRDAQVAVSNYVASTALDQSTAETVASSNAATKPYVFAYSITSTKGSNYAVTFFDGATLRWVVNVSSGYGGANLAVTPPAYLFAGSTGAKMQVQTASSLTAGGAAICVSYYTGA
jgi:hypothetical protein